MVTRADIKRAIRALSAPVVHDALVTSAPLVEGHSAGYVIATVAGQAGVRVSVSPDAQPPATPGDTIRVQAYGSPSATSYQMIHRTAGVRADSSRWTFSQDTIVNGETYAAGDQILGSSLAGMPNWYYKFSEGRWYSRVGTTVYGYDDASGDRCWGPPTGMNFFYDASESALLIRDGSTETARIDGDTLSLIGFQRLGYVHGPALELGHIDDVDEDGDPVLVGGVQQRRYYLRMVGEEGLPIISILSGTQTDPDNAALLISSPGSAQYLKWENGTLSLSGTINASAGTIGGWRIESNRLESTNGKVALVSDDEANFAEGYSLLCGFANQSGAIKWYLDSLDSDKSMGIDFTYIDDTYSPYTIVKQSQVSAVHWGGTTAEHRWVAGHYGADAKTLRFDSDGFLTLEDGVYLRTNHITTPTAGGVSDLEIHALSNVLWIPGTAIMPDTNDGAVARANNYTDYTWGPVGSALINDKEIVLPFTVPQTFCGCQVYIASMELHWYKVVDAAYWTTIWLAYWNTTTAGKIAAVTVSNLGSGTLAGWYASELLSTSYQMIDAPHNLVLKPTGMRGSPNFDLKVAGLKVTYVTV